MQYKGSGNPSKLLCCPVALTATKSWQGVVKKRSVQKWYLTKLKKKKKKKIKNKKKENDNLSPLDC